MAWRYRVALTVVCATLLAGCAGSGGELPWSVSREPRELSVDYVVHYIYVVPGYVPRAPELSLVAIRDAGDVNGDGGGDLQIVYLAGDRVHSVVVLSGATIPSGPLSALRKAGRVRPILFRSSPSSPLDLERSRFRKGALADLNGDGVHEHAVLRQAHKSVTRSCADSPGCTFTYSATEVTLYSGQSRIARIATGWYSAPPVYLGGKAYTSLKGGYATIPDWNGDGRPDLLYYDGYQGTRVLAFTRDGLEAEQLTYPHGKKGEISMLLPPVAVDLDANGTPDIAGQTIPRLDPHSDPRYLDSLTIAVLSPRH